MKGYCKICMLSLMMASSIFIVSCSGGNGSNRMVNEESIYTPGASLGAVDYKGSCKIDLQIQGETGDYTPALDGQFMQAGTKKFRVKVEGDETDIDKVLISDGGSYQVVAVKQGDYYQADYTFLSDRLYTPVLIQAIHNNNRASKEKIVFKTFNDESNSKIILDGIGVIASNDLIKSNRYLLASQLDSVMKQAFADIKVGYPGTISHLSYGDNDPDTLDIEIVDFAAAHDAAYPSAVIHLAFIIHDVDLTAINIKGQDLITTTDNDLKVEMYVGLQDQGENNRRCLVFDLMGSTHVTFQNDFLLRPVFEDKIASGFTVMERSPFVTELNTLFSTLRNNLPLSILINGSQVDIASLFDKQNIDLSKYLFIDLYGVPENTYEGVLALGAGLHLAETKPAGLSPSKLKPGNNPDFDGVIIDLCQVMVDKAFGSIKNQYKGLISTLTYGDTNSDASDFIINSIIVQDTGDTKTKMIRAIFTLKDVDLNAASLFGISLIKTQDNDLTIDASFLLYSSDNSGQIGLTMDIQQVSDVSFQDYFLGKSAVEALASNSIANLENFSTSINTIVSALSLDIDLSRYGYQGPEFPDVIDTLSPYEWDLRLPEGNNLSLIISQDNINYALAQLFARGFEWDIHEILLPILGNDFEGFNAGTGNYQETIMRLRVPPVFDLRSSEIRMQADDIFIEYRINSEPQWEASVDLDVVLDIRVVGNELAFFINPKMDKCNFHIMKDNIGNLGIFDHSNLVNDLIIQLPKMLGDSVGGPIFTINLKSLEPLITLNSIERPITITAEGGYLYIDMDALDLDFSAFTDTFVKL